MLKSKQRPFVENKIKKQQKVNKTDEYHKVHQDLIKLTRRIRVVSKYVKLMKDIKKLERIAIKDWQEYYSSLTSDENKFLEQD